MGYQNQESVSSGSKNQSKPFGIQTADRVSGQSLTVPKVSIQLPIEKKPPVRGPVRLVSRDLEILEFILDMKFSSLEEVFQKFFSVTKAETRAKSSDWARDRLARLEQYGYLKSFQVGVPQVKYYIATEKAYQSILTSREVEKLPKHMNTIDHRILIHDRMVLKSRIEFEKVQPEGKWISDRKLRAGMASMFGLPSAYIPDAIYELPTGERVAFELENAHKGKSAYEEKIVYFVKLMRARKDDPNMFSRVRYRCLKEAVFKQLTELTAMYGEMFSVELWEPEFLKVQGGEA